VQAGTLSRLARLLWVQRTSEASVSDSDLKACVRQSQRLAALNLWQKVQKGLGLAPK
jgi:predicted DNA-binding protein (MmcQ/YjbR family)